MLRISDWPQHYASPHKTSDKWFAFVLSGDDDLSRTTDFLYLDQQRRTLLLSPEISVNVAYIRRLVDWLELPIIHSGCI